jgi:hypothetical protein
MVWATALIVTVWGSAKAMAVTPAVNGITYFTMPKRQRMIIRRL